MQFLYDSNHFYPFPGQDWLAAVLSDGKDGRVADNDTVSGCWPTVVSWQRLFKAKKKPVCEILEKKDAEEMSLLALNKNKSPTENAAII